MIALNGIFTDACNALRKETKHSGMNSFINFKREILCIRVGGIKIGKNWKR